MFFSLQLIVFYKRYLRMPATETMDVLVRIKHLKLEKRRFIRIIDHLTVLRVTFYVCPFLMDVHLKLRLQSL